MNDDVLQNTDAMSSHQYTLTDLQLLSLIAAVRFLLHLLTNNQYGFHQDALAFLANGLYLDWGYVAYPPLTPFIGRIGLELFGVSLVGIKSLAALAQCIAMVFTGLMAKELGGGRKAQVLAAIAAGIGLMSLIMGTLFQYITFDYLWWVLILYCLLRLLKSDNPRWWFGIGIFIGLGMMTKYTMAFLVISLVMVVLFTRLRRHLSSRWLWIGALLSFLILLPNFVWQINHDFISYDFLSFISNRDKLLGRADGFFSQQLYVNINPFVLPLVFAGVVFYFSEAGKQYRALGYIFVLTLGLFAAANGRFYYTAPLYPMLIAAGATASENWVRQRSALQQKRFSTVTVILLFMGGGIGVALMLPVAPVHSLLWNVTSDIHDNFIDQIGWEELVESTASIYQNERDGHDSLGILTSHYGSASAFHLYGDQYGLPLAISPVDSFWLRGYGENPPDAVIAIGFTVDELAEFFDECHLVGQNQNKYQIEKPLSEIYLCESAKGGWETIWPALLRFA
jgi:4-amino-4-deoxy-L-arabinose transferase-like glycosyltransferase